VAKIKEADADILGKVTLVQVKKYDNHYASNTGEVNWKCGLLRRLGNIA
jgi:hypothetical protein